jgi:hypothetical protein
MEICTTDIIKPKITVRNRAVIEITEYPRYWAREKQRASLFYTWRLYINKKLYGCKLNECKSATNVIKHNTFSLTLAARNRE